MNILGISAFYHDSAAAIVQDGTITAAAHEERFTRKKHDSSFPIHAVSFCLSHAALSIDALDAVVFYDKPLLKFERLLETYYAFAPDGLVSFVHAIPVWVKEKMFLKEIIREKLAEIEPYDKKKLKLLFPEHHLSHAASAFYPSPYDGGGDTYDRRRRRVGDRLHRHRRGQTAFRSSRRCDFPIRSGFSIPRSPTISDSS